MAILPQLGNVPFTRFPRFSCCWTLESHAGNILGRRLFMPDESSCVDTWQGTQDTFVGSPDVLSQPLRGRGGGGEKHG